MRDSKDSQTNYNDLEKEVKTRKRELEILGDEKIRAELNVRNQIKCLEMTRDSLANVLNEVNIALLKSEQKEDEKPSVKRERKSSKSDGDKK